MKLIQFEENLETKVQDMIDQGEGHRVFTFFHSIMKQLKKYEAQTKPYAIDYWQENKELTDGYSCRETNRSSYDYGQDPKWQMLSAQLKAREKLLKQSADDMDHDVFDELGEIVPKVQKKQTAIFTFSQK